MALIIFPIHLQRENINNSPANITRQKLIKVRFSLNMKRVYIG